MSLNLKGRSRSHSYVEQLFIQKQGHEAPILYITGQSTYDGILHSDYCTEEKLWNELTENTPIKNTLVKWKKDVLQRQQRHNQLESSQKSEFNKYHSQLSEISKENETLSALVKSLNDQILAKYQQIDSIDKTLNDEKHRSNKYSSQISEIALKHEQLNQKLVSLNNELKQKTKHKHDDNEMETKYDPNDIEADTNDTELAQLMQLTSQIQMTVKQIEITAKEIQIRDNEALIDKIVQFRMVLHRVKDMKLSYGKGVKDQINDEKNSLNNDNRNDSNQNVTNKYKATMESASGNKFFALIWVPSNKADGMKLEHFEDLIDSMRSAQYYVNQLNKECIYISGPNYGDVEIQTNTQSKHPFGLRSLRKRCERLIESDVDKDTLSKLDIEIAVHRLDREDRKKGIEKMDSINTTTILNPTSQRSKHHDYDKVATFLQLTSATNIEQQTSLETENNAPRKPSFAGRRSSQWENQPMIGSDNLKEIKSNKSALLKEDHVFAFVWFNVKKRDKKTKDINAGTLPALSVMNQLHQKPYGDFNQAFNVEICGYDRCYKNLDSIVDRNMLKMEAFLVLIQCIFLPIFILIPPFKIRKCFTDNAIKPRYRPCHSIFEELDRTEQIPYDITALWKLKQRSYVFRLCSFVVSLILVAIIYIGPFFLYDRPNENNYEAKHLSAFDCFGPLFFYFLGVFTVIWWSCHSRVTIGPKEHLLLYYKLFIQRPVEGSDHMRRTDWAALTALTHQRVLNALIYAHRKGFLEFRTWTHGLLSRRKFIGEGRSSWKLCKSYLWYITAVISFLGAQNLENFQLYHRPFYVDESVNDHSLKMVYAMFSNICSCMLLICFILLFDTMFNRMARQHENVKSLSNLIVRNTYSEYIEFDWVDNILSWLALEKLVKRKGMMLFASLETPLFTLFLLSLVSWSGTVYCVFLGIGLALENDASLFSNTTLAVWFYLAMLSFVTVVRMLWYGHKFEKESKQQQLAIKSQCGEMHSNYLMQQLKNDKLSRHEQHALKTSQMLLSWVEHTEIVPKVFGIKFDELTAKAGWTAVVSVLPTILAFVASKITLQL